jgi:hypothetical protein
MEDRTIIDKRHGNTRADIIILLDRLSFIERTHQELTQIQKDYDMDSDNPEEKEEMYQKLLKAQREFTGELMLREEYHGLTYPSYK